MSSRVSAPDQPEPAADGPEPAGFEVLPALRVDSVEGLKAMADPLRLALLQCVGDRDGIQRTWSAKELAAALGEPQTKLYRHLKVLHEAGLIQVAETRLVSGIVETRYAAVARALNVARELFTADPGEEQVSLLLDTLDAAAAAFSQGVVAAARSGGLDMDAAEPVRRPLFMSGETWIDAARAADFRSRLQALVDEFSGHQDEDGADVRMNLMVAYYVTPTAEPSASAPD